MVFFLLSFYTGWPGYSRGQRSTRRTRETWPIRRKGGRGSYWATRRQRLSRIARSSRSPRFTRTPRVSGKKNMCFLGVCEFRQHESSMCWAVEIQLSNHLSENVRYLWDHFSVQLTDVEKIYPHDQACWLVGSLVGFLVLTNQYGFSIQIIFKFFMFLRAKVYIFANKKEGKQKWF